jgi:hypothetical protein
MQLYPDCVQSVFKNHMFLLLQILTVPCGNLSCKHHFSLSTDLQRMLIPLTVVVIMQSSYAPGVNEMVDDGLTRPSKPFGPFNS